MFFTGPEMAGKTTFINWIMGKDFDKNYTPTTDMDTVVYKDDEHDFSITDMGGGSEFLETHGFDKLVREHDITVLVFDVQRFFNDDKYRQEVGDRLHFLWHMEGDIEKFKKTLFIVGSHFDKTNMSLEHEARKEFSKFVEKKDYANLIIKHRIHFADLTQEKDAKKLMSDLKQKIKKQNEK